MKVALTELKSNFEKQLAYLLKWVTIGDEDEKNFIQNIIAGAILTVDNIDIEECDKIFFEGLEVKEYDLSNINEITSLLQIAFALLTKYGLTKEEYLEWLQSQNTNADFFLYGLVGEDVAEEQKKEVRDAIIQEVLKVSPAYKAVYISECPQGVNIHTYRLLDKYVVFEADFKKQLEIIDFMDSLIQDGIEDWNDAFEQEIRTLDQCVDKLPALSTLFVSRTFARSLRFLKKKGVVSEKDKLRFKEEFNYKIDIFGEYYGEFIDSYIKIIERLDKGLSVNLLHQLSQVKGEWVGGGFGVKGMVEGAALAGVANIATDAIGELAGFLKEQTIRGNWNYEKKKLYNSPQFRERFLDYINEAIMALYPAFAKALHIEILRDSDYQMEKNLENILDGEIELADREFKDFLLDYLVRMPFDEEIYTIIFENYGSTCGEIEGLVTYLGIASEYHEDKIKNLKSIEQDILDQYDEYDREELAVLCTKLDEYVAFYGIEKSIQMKQLQKRKERADELYERRKLIDKYVEEEQFDKVVEEALAGAPYAEYVLGVNYSNDRCSNCDLMKANQWKALGRYVWSQYLSCLKPEFHEYKEWAEKDVISANIPIALYKIETWLENTEEGIRMLRELALWQQPEAAYQLGEIYYYGKVGVKKNEKYALKYLCWAGEIGHKKAIGILSRDKEYINNELVKKILFEDDMRNKREIERKRVEEERKKAEAEKKRIEEERKKAEAEKKRIEEERKKAEAEKKRIEEERKKAEAEKKRIQEERRKAKAVEKTIEKEKKIEGIKETRKEPLNSKMESEIIRNKMFCPYCGNQILRSVKFCNFCGERNTYEGGL